MSKTISHYWPAASRSPVFPLPRTRLRPPRLPPGRRNPPAPSPAACKTSSPASTSTRPASRSRAPTTTVFTDNFGTYQLVGVPAGPATLEVFYTDLDPVTLTVNVPAGGTVEQNVDLTSVKRYGADAQHGASSTPSSSPRTRRPTRRPSPPTSSASRPTSRTSCRPMRSATSSAAASASS